MSRYRAIDVASDMVMPDRMSDAISPGWSLGCTSDTATILARKAARSSPCSVIEAQISIAMVMNKRTASLSVTLEHKQHPLQQKQYTVML